MRLRKHLVSVLLAVLLATPGFAYGSKIILHVNPVSLAWSTSRIDEAVVTRFTREREFQFIISPTDRDSIPAFPGSGYNIDSLSNWGAELGGRYLLSIDVKSERLDKKRTLHIPLILHRFETVGVIDAEIRLLDLERGRMILAVPLTVELSARRVVQTDPDKDKNDADIHLLASDKEAFFTKLERKFAEKLYGKIFKALRNR